MSGITVSATRTIIEDFAKEIQRRKSPTAKPSKTVINFRDERSARFERDIWLVPTEILRYRKDNGRIASDVLDYEKNVGILDETDERAQATIEGFLKEKDPEKTAILRKSIMHTGQDFPAIVTCDGFLINGNRRKMVMEMLAREHPDEDSYRFMKAVILPGEGDPGGAPTLYEIEKLENRYQLQSDGRSEYYGFDRALSMKRKIDVGLSLEEQLRDDPQYAGATQAEIDRAVKESEAEYLEPLKCVDRYLKQFNREGQYRTISSGRYDPEGRWEAFKDYSKTYTRYLCNPKRLIELGIAEDEIGEIEEAAFDIIRLRSLPDLPKAHMIMRALPKYCSTADGRKALLRIVREVGPVLLPNECLAEDGTPLGPSEVDAKWAAEHRQAIIYNTKKAASTHEIRKEKDTSLTLLDAAYKKLTHEEMQLQKVELRDLKTARELTLKIKARAEEIESEIYQCEKECKKIEQRKQ